jgi:hypothetical protein
MPCASFRGLLLKELSASKLLVSHGGGKWDLNIFVCLKVGKIIVA